MREGELCALKWKNVHLDDGYIHVDESVKRVAVFDSKENKTMQTLVLDPKSQKSIRDIDIPAILIDKLKELPHVSEYVFSNSNEPITHKSVSYTHLRAHETF